MNLSVAYLLAEKPILFLICFWFGLSSQLAPDSISCFEQRSNWSIEPLLKTNFLPTRVITWDMFDVSINMLFAGCGSPTLLTVIASWRVCGGAARWFAACCAVRIHRSCPDLCSMSTGFWRAWWHCVLAVPAHHTGQFSRQPHCALPF